MRGNGAISDFVALRDGFSAIESVLRQPGKVEVSSRGAVRVDGRRHEFAQAKSRGDTIKRLLMGEGARASLAGSREIVMAMIASPDAEGGFEICCIEVKSRASIQQSISIKTTTKDWEDLLAKAFDWSEVTGVIAAAEGNNQRAGIGAVLARAGIGRGKLEMIEADLPEEIDEAAQSVRGADWLKAGLPRFQSAAGEALWYLMRIRAVHMRKVQVRKQGYYTALALGAGRAAGLSVSQLAQGVGMSEALVERLLPKVSGKPVTSRDLAPLGADYAAAARRAEMQSHCVQMVWKGAAIYTAALDRRIRLSGEARSRLAVGEDLLSIAQDLRIHRRNLIRILSVSQSDLIEERERFVKSLGQLADWSGLLSGAV